VFIRNVGEALRYCQTRPSVGLFKPRLGLFHRGKVDGTHQRVAVVPPAAFLGATVVLRSVVDADPCPLGDIEVGVGLDFLDKRFHIHRPHHNPHTRESKGESDSSQEFNNRTWHGPCFTIVSRFGHPESENYEKPYCITIGLLYYYLL